MLRRIVIGALAAGLSSVAIAAHAAPEDGGAVARRVRRYRQAHAVDILRQFTGLLAIPNRATDAGNIGRNADRIVEMLRARGFSARLLDGEGGPPAVYGELPAPGAHRTLVVYAHYDGQPVDPTEWTDPPFSPVLRDGTIDAGGKPVPLESVAGASSGEWRLYGRSTSDDKAPIVGLLTAVDALKAGGVARTVNLKVFFEGEEEAGSPHLERILTAHRDLLRGDAWILCDGPVHQSRRMQLFFGARGITDLALTVYGPLRRLHSGHYGNWAPNPAVRLAHLIAGLRDEDGKILIDGFYDDVRPLSPGAREALAAVPDVDEALRKELGLAATEAGNARLVERILLPALNVRGLEAGAVGARAANAIPTEARASIDFRLVPDETPGSVRRRVEDHLRKRGWFLVDAEPDLTTRLAHPRIVRLAWGSGYPPARTSLDLPISRALSRIVGEARGEPVIRMPSLGGSIPMYLFQEVLGVPVVGLPIANHDNNQHAADENIRLQNLWDGIEVYGALLARLGPALEPAP